MPVSRSPLERDQDKNIPWWCIHRRKQHARRVSRLPADPHSLLTAGGAAAGGVPAATIVGMSRTIPFFLVDLGRTTLTGVGQELPPRPSPAPASMLTLCDPKTRRPLFDFAVPGTLTHRHTPDAHPTLAVLHYRQRTLVWLLGPTPIGDVKKDHLKKLRQRFQNKDDDRAVPESVVAGATTVLRALVAQICPDLRLPSRLIPLRPATVGKMAAALSESKKLSVRSTAAKCAQTINTICDCIASDTSLRRSTEDTLVQLMCSGSCFAAHLAPHVVVDPAEVKATLDDQQLDMSPRNATSLEKTLLQLYEAFLVLAVAAGADRIDANHTRNMVDADDSFLGLHHRKIHAVTRASRGVPGGTTRRVMFRRVAQDPAACDAFLASLAAYVRERGVAATDVRRRMRAITDAHGIRFVVSHGRGTVPNHMRLFERRDLSARLRPLQWIWLLWHETLRQHGSDTLTVPTFLDLMFRDPVGIDMVRAYVGWHAVVSRRLAVAPVVPSGVVQARRSEKSKCNLFGPPLRLAIAALWAYVEAEFPDPTFSEQADDDHQLRRVVCARLTSVAAAWCLQVWFGFRPHVLEEIQICTVPQFEALDPTKTQGVDMQFGLFVVYDRFPDPQTLRVHIHDTKPVVSGNMGNGKRRRLTTDRRYRAVVPVREAGIWSDTAPVGLRRVLLRLIPAYADLTRPTPDRCYVPDLRPEASGQLPRVRVHTLPWPTTCRAASSRYFIRPDAVGRAPPELRTSVCQLHDWFGTEIAAKRATRADFFLDQPPHHRSFWRTGRHPKRFTGHTVRTVTEVLRQFLKCEDTITFFVGTKDAISRGSLAVGRLLAPPVTKKRGGGVPDWWVGRVRLATICGSSHIFKPNHAIDDVDLNTLRVVRSHHATLRLGFDRAGRHSTMAGLLGVDRFLRCPLMQGTVQESYATRVRELLEADMASTMRREAHLSRKIVEQHYDKLATADPFVDLAQHVEHLDRRLESYPAGRWPDYLVTTTEQQDHTTTTLSRASDAHALDFHEQMRQLLWFDTLKKVCAFTRCHEHDLKSCPHPPTTLIDFVSKRVLKRYVLQY